MSVTVEGVGQADCVPVEFRAAWAAPPGPRHGQAAAELLAAAENFADAVPDVSIPENTTDTYATGWKVWQRFCAEPGLPETEGASGALVAYVAWMLDRGRSTPGRGSVLGYAPSSAHPHLTAAVAGPRDPSAVGATHEPNPVTHPTRMLGLRIRYWDPFIDDYPPVRTPYTVGRWDEQDNALLEVGL